MTRGAILIVAAFLFAVGIYLRFSYAPELPPRPRRPPPVDINTFRALDYSQNVWRARLEKDAADLGVSLDPLNTVFRHSATEPRRILHAGGDALETSDLTLSLRSEKMSMALERGRITTDHLILRIENRTARYLAYRIVAPTPIDTRACVEKADIAHNAIAIRPHETIERTECGRDGVSTLTVERVETVALPALAYQYVSQLHPVHIGLDSRATHGHKPPQGSACGDIPEQAILRAMEKNEASWRDVIDFYARHNCRYYIFPVGYRAFTKDDERPLPVRPGFAPAAP